MSARESAVDESGALRLASAIAIVVFCASLAMRSRILETQDLYYHIVVGRWTLAHLAIPDRGLFSGSLPDAPWLAHEWLASAFSAVAYDLGGWNGLVAAAALASLARSESSPTKSDGRLGRSKRSLARCSPGV